MERRMIPPERTLPLDDFIKATAPAYKESRLLPYWEEIRMARSRRYTLAQIREWLSQNGIDISIQGISRFIIVQTARDRGPGSVGSTETLQTESAKSNSVVGVVAGSMGKRKDQREQTAARFIREDSNTVLNILKDQSK